MCVCGGGGGYLPHSLVVILHDRVTVALKISTGMEKKKTTT